MRIVTRPADTAIDPASDDDGGGTLPPGTNSAGVSADGERGTDGVGLCPHGVQGELRCLAVPPLPPERRRRLSPGSPMGPRETVKYGLRALSIGEASHPGPPDTDFGDRDRVQHAAVVAAKVARIDELVAAMRAEYQTLPAERYGLVGAHTPGDPARAPPRDLPRSARRSGTPSSARSSSVGAPPTSDGGGTSHRTSQTTTSSFYARIRGDVGAGTGDGHATPPAAFGSGEEGPWSLSPGSPHEGGLADADFRGPAPVGFPRIRTAGWGLTRPAGEFAAAGQASLSRRRLSIAPVVGARGKCLIRRRPLMTLSPRRLAGAGATLGRLAISRGGMGFCPTRRSTSIKMGVPVGCSARALLGPGRTGVSL